METLCSNPGDLNAGQFYLVGVGAPMHPRSHIPTSHHVAKCGLAHSSIMHRYIS